MIIANIREAPALEKIFKELESEFEITLPKHFVIDIRYYPEQKNIAKDGKPKLCQILPYPLLQHLSDDELKCIIMRSYYHHQADIQRVKSAYPYTLAIIDLQKKFNEAPLHAEFMMYFIGHKLHNLAEVTRTLGKFPSYNDFPNRQDRVNVGVVSTKIDFKKTNSEEPLIESRRFTQKTNNFAESEYFKSVEPEIYETFINIAEPEDLAPSPEITIAPSISRLTKLIIEKANSYNSGDRLPEVDEMVFTNDAFYYSVAVGRDQGIHIYISFLRFVTMFDFEFNLTVLYCQTRTKYQDHDNRDETPTLVWTELASLFEPEKIAIYNAREYYFAFLMNKFMAKKFNSPADVQASAESIISKMKIPILFETIDKKFTQSMRDNGLFKNVKLNKERIDSLYKEDQVRSFKVLAKAALADETIYKRLLGMVYLYEKSTRKDAA